MTEQAERVQRTPALSKAQKQKKHVRDAVHAHSDLNIFATVVSILEGGHLYSSKSHRTAERIIRICKEECDKRLREYDAAVARSQLDAESK